MTEDAVVDEWARVHESVRLSGVAVGAFAVIEEQVAIGAGSALAEHVIVRSRARLGERCRIDSFTVLGGEPQYTGFDSSTPSRVEIGNDVHIREGVTIHRSIEANGVTAIGDGVFIMAGAHVAHDCVVGPRTVLANDVLLAGHVVIGEDVMLGGGSGVHQFSRVGDGVMVAGHSTVTLDVPPYTMVVERNGIAGLNQVGLRRRGVDRESIDDIKKCYRAVYGDGDDPRVRAEEALAAGECGHTTHGHNFLEFFAGGTRGFARPRRGTRSRDSQPGSAG